MVLITDADESGWKKINEDEESVDFLPTGELLSMIDSSTVPANLTTDLYTSSMMKIFRLTISTRVTAGSRQEQ